MSVVIGTVRSDRAADGAADGEPVKSATRDGDQLPSAPRSLPEILNCGRYRPRPRRQARFPPPDPDRTLHRHLRDR